MLHSKHFVAMRRRTCSCALKDISVQVALKLLIVISFADSLLIGGCDARTCVQCTNSKTMVLSTEVLQCTCTSALC